MDRRYFLKKAGLGTAVLVGAGFPVYALGNEPEFEKLTILHTNDVHSRIDPFPMDGGRNQGLGGVSKRAAMIKNIRAEEKNVLLLDAGDIFQGTPYFNFFGGEIEMKLMSEMKYDCGTMGNHDFDAGIDGFEKQLKHANFPFVVSNYNLEDTVLHDRVEKYKIFELGGLKIGIFGLGIRLDGLVPKKLQGKAVYEEPVAKANHYASFLKNEMKCDYVICLSHLGFYYENRDRPSDHTIALQTTNVDMILGGHTHTFLKMPKVVRNPDDKEVVISQAGWAGILLGRIDILFEKTNGKKCTTCKNTFVK